MNIQRLNGIVVMISVNKDQINLTVNTIQNPTAAMF